MLCLNGEAYFPSIKTKVNVSLSAPIDYKAEVLGTEFNMEAYAADSSVRTTLVSGSIRLSFLDDNQKHKSFLMKPNEEFTYNQYTKKVKVDKPYIPTQTSWKDGLVVFRNTPFNEALKVLSKRFNVEFIVKNDKLYNNSSQDLRWTALTTNPRTFPFGFRYSISLHRPSNWARRKY